MQPLDAVYLQILKNFNARILSEPVPLDGVIRPPYTVWPKTLFASVSSAIF